MAENPEGTYVVPLDVRVENAQLDTKKERGLRISAWTTVYRGDAGAVGSTTVTDLTAAALGPEDHKPSYGLNLVLPRGGGSPENPWPADAYAWFAAEVFAPSSDGPLVGSEGGWASVRLRDIRDYVVGRSRTIPLKLLLQQMGLDHPYNKMDLRIMGVAPAFVSTVRSWVFSEIVDREDFVTALMPHHDLQLEQYVATMMFPFSDEAQLRGLDFRPSHQAITPLHAPLWMTNVPVPQWAFWSQFGDRPRGAAASALGGVLRGAFDIVMRRHDWEGGPHDFVSLVLKQTQTLDSETYDSRYTYACAVLCDVCALFATQLYYKYDETYVPKRDGDSWFSTKGWNRLDVESFHDAMAMLGGDCEDLASLIHRVFRWLQLGRPELRARPVGDGTRLSDDTAHRLHGGWEDENLDALQRMAYWYVSGGSIGSVTSSRVESGAGGVTPDLIIGGDLDESLSIGGHMWNTMIPVNRVEDLLARFDKDGKRTRLRPYYPRRAYPPWLKFTPYLVGEGTGALYPLIMPLQTYMATAEARADARERHRRRLAALSVVQNETKTLRRLQVQRWAGDIDTASDRRPSYFYRRESNFFTDDFANNNIPHWFLTWVLTSPRKPESAAVPAPGITPGRVDAIPGSGGPGSMPTWGVDMRDKILADSTTFGDGKPGVAMVMGPATPDSHMASFKSRMKQLRPWKLPVITPESRRKASIFVEGHIPAFQRRVEQVLAEQGALARISGATLSSTRVNIIFRRDEFAFEEVRVRALADVRAISAKIVRIEFEFEYPFDDGYSVNMSLWIVDEDVA